MKTLIVSIVILLAGHGLASESSLIEILSQPQFMYRQLPDLKNIDWKVGDFQERQIKSGALRVGRLKSWVDREEGSAFWLINDLKIILKKKQVIEVLIERESGEILKYIVDGEEETPPDMTKVNECKELSEAKEQITVPTGTYDTTRTIAQCEDDFLAIWQTEEAVNMDGHIKQAVLEDPEEPNKQKYVVEITKFGNQSN